jgi:hypothetical protein
LQKVLKYVEDDGLPFPKQSNKLSLGKVNPIKSDGLASERQFCLEII